MSLATVARKDVQDAVRSRSLWFLTGIFLVMSTFVTYAALTAPELAMITSDPTTGTVAFLLSGVVSLLVSLSAIVIGYRALAGEREIGSMKIMLSLPHTRRDVVLGKFLGRAAVLSIPVLVGLVGAALVASVVMAEFSIVEFAPFVALALVFAVAYTSIVVGLSAISSSTARASALAVGFLLVFDFVWSPIVTGLAYVVNGFAMPTELAAWTVVLMQLSPGQAFSTGIVAVMPEFSAVTTGASPTASVTPWIGVVALGLWIVVPIVLGTVRFGRADI